MDTNIFVNKTTSPTPADLFAAFADTYTLWEDICALVYHIYLLPGNKFFMVAFVFGQKAFEKK